MAELRVRREPPRLRAAIVRRSEPLTARLRRVVVGGPELAGLDPGLPAASVRLLLPAPDGQLVLPTWNGNEFLLPDGTRPLLRTLTPRWFDPDALELAVDVVLHEGGPLAAWATSAAPGSAVAVSGTGRGYTIDTEASGFLLAGDESALPAISQLLEAIPASTPAEVLVEVSQPDARLELPGSAAVRETWLDRPAGAGPGDALVAAVRSAPIEAGTRVWAAGEAAAMQRIRKHLFDERGIARADTVVRGYWKRGRAGDDDA